ncbi:MAG: hypothetical protein AB7D57_09395 [Desulfovibrionaceae bacterium]
MDFFLLRLLIVLGLLALGIGPYLRVRLGRKQTLAQFRRAAVDTCVRPRLAPGETVLAVSGKAVSGLLPGLVLLVPILGVFLFVQATSAERWLTVVLLGILAVVPLACLYTCMFASLVVTDQALYRLGASEGQVSRLPGTAIRSHDLCRSGRGPILRVNGKPIPGWFSAYQNTEELHEAIGRCAVLARRRAMGDEDAGAGGKA